MVWANIGSYGLTGNDAAAILAELGISTTASSSEVQKGIRKRFNDNGIKIMVSAFGATEMPTSRGFNATTCGTNLAKFVKANNLDGADADY